MPIFQDPDRQWSYRRPATSTAPEASTSFDTTSHGASGADDAPGGTYVDSYGSPELRGNDIQGLIRSIKSRASSPWTTSHSLESYSDPRSREVSPEPGVSAKRDGRPPLLPAAEIEESPRQDTSVERPPSQPYDIERPRSALHSGDFRQGLSQSPEQGKLLGRGQDPRPFGSPPPLPWNKALASTRQYNESTPNVSRSAEILSRSRAPSLGSFSSSYILKAPTSPLVHQANNPDLDFSPRIDLMDLATTKEKANRRRTLPPETFQSMQSSPPSLSGGVSFKHPVTWRREATFPYQKHTSRRSLTSSYTLQPASSPHTPPSLARSRRLSFSSSDMAPRNHASMVGSYEESIIRGRMSTTPSKPLNFTAQIGVLGRGNCRANLRCPPHVTISFPAVFYSYPTSGSGRSISDDSPSPYVGHIDIENSLPAEEKSTHRHRRKAPSPFTSREISHDENQPHAKSQASLTSQLERRRREKRSRRSQSPKSPPGGCYRIPQQGQLQIIIKNPNKTAVKLFLVPYDLDGMEPGTKTFIRQRSYSAGPTIDMPLSARNNLGTDRPEASLGTSEDPGDRPMLRYLIHLNICCTGKGRYYLYSGIRVVFANRVPDAEERLRNEIQYPDPRYSAYKPARESTANSSNSRLAAEKAFRRRSAGLGLSNQMPIELSGLGRSEPHGEIQESPLQLLDSPNLLPSSETAIQGSSSPTLQAFRGSHISHPPTPWSLDGTMQTPSNWAFEPLVDRPVLPPPSTMSSPAPGMPVEPSSSREMYSKIAKDDPRYGRNIAGISTTGEKEEGESLLAQKLKGLDVLKRELSDQQ